ncbi:MAG: hypothetical protein JW727_00950, partial [Candidatus Aenigmarchaeota archaeon]|nr:hypothetical protein [Candidatus Aenigmarchaeota archaeon]
IPFAFFGGWLGISKQGEALAEKLLADTGYNFLVERKIYGITTPYVDLRVFELDCGHTKIYGEMKTKKLFVEKEGRVYEMPLLKYDASQYLRMLKKAVNFAIKNEAPNIGNLRLIMGALFDAQEMIEVELPIRSAETELRASKDAIEIFCKANKLKPTSPCWQSCQ